MKILILGIGNPILGDDAVGILVANELKKRIAHSDIEVEATSAISHYLWDIASGYDKLIIIDSIITGKKKAGSIYRLKPEELEKKYLPASSHQIGIIDALTRGRKLGFPIPQKIVVYAIEVKDNITFSESCTPEVMKAIPRTVKKIIKDIEIE
jgi:hydrogenase maturation protease